MLGVMVADVVRMTSIISTLEWNVWDIKAFEFLCP